MTPSPSNCPPVLEFFAASSFAAQRLPERRFLVPGLVPSKCVTLLSGDGGVGKSHIALQLAYAVASASHWLGMAVERGRAVYVSAEDDKDEVHRRLAALCNATGADLARLDDLEIVPLAGKVSIMAVEGSGGLITPTPLWTALAARVEAKTPALLVLDTAADIFGGNEISRAQVRQFISMLNSLALRAGCAIVLLSHPSVAGMQSGTGISGSTAWNNSVRSRLYMLRPPADADGVVDPDARLLQHMKANYGPISSEIRLRWSDALFLNENAGPVAAPARHDKAAIEAKADAVFLDLLQRFAAEGRDVSAKPSVSYAPTRFAEHPDARGTTKRALAAAMNRLLGNGRVRIENFGPPSKPRSRLAFMPSVTIE